MSNANWNTGATAAAAAASTEKRRKTKCGEIGRIQLGLVDGGGLATKNDAIQLHHWNKTAKGNKTRMIAIIHRLKWANCLGRKMCELPPILCVCSAAKLYCQMFLKFRIRCNMCYHHAYTTCALPIMLRMHTQQISTLSPNFARSLFLSSCSVLHCMAYYG